MYINTITLLYGFLVLAIIVLFLLLRRMARIRFWIHVSPKVGSPMQKVGYLEMSDDGGAGEVHLPGAGGLHPIGRVIANNESKVNRGEVEVITTDVEDDASKPRYIQCGYICFDDTTQVDEYGFIYKQVKGKKKKELLGYCARPSAPNVPTLVGERTWKTLWLVKTLHAYSGKPTQEDESTIVKEDSKKIAKKEGVHKLVGIHGNESKVDNEITDLVSAEESQKAELNDIALNEVTPQEDAPVEAAPQEEMLGKEPPAAEKDVKGTLAEESPIEDVSKDEASKEETKALLKEDNNLDKEEAKKNKKTKKKKVSKQPLAVVKSFGIHFNSNKYLPAEARACAYALLSRYSQKSKYTEYYKNSAYGWSDTALLTSLIYAILYILLYTVNTGVLQLPLLGDDLLAVGILVAFYPMLWAMVRLIKITSIENSNSIQSRLDILNKTLRLNGQNYAIIILALFSIYFTLDYYDFDFIPLIIAILIGVIVNMTNKNAKASWVICSSYTENDVDLDEDAEIINPPGDISRTYEWSLDSSYSSQDLNGSITLYFSASEMHDVRQCNPFFFQRKDKSDKEYILDMFEVQTSHRKAFLARIKYIAHYINRIIAEHNLTPLDKIQFTLDFIQEPNILYANNLECQEINYYEDYIRFPEETLYDKKGDCNSKSLLAAMLFHEMGYNVLYLASRKFQHAAVGIEINPKDLSSGWYGSEKKIKEMVMVEDNRSYIYCETTGDRFSIGSTIEGMTLADFEDKVLLPVSAFEDEADDMLEQTETRIYNWDLHTEDQGSKLHGNLTLDFSKTAINSLREENPFRTYGKDQNTYEVNVQTMFAYLFNDAELYEKPRLVADYIRKTIAEHGLTELDMVQFALDFVQVPNIAYCIDEDSASISFAKEYMRYPDEVLFDKEGDCDCKSSLAIAIFHSLGYNTLMMISKKCGHAAVGIECKEEWLSQIASQDLFAVCREYNGKKYIYCETTGDGYKVGHIKEGDSIQDFETLVEIPV